MQDEFYKILKKYWSFDRFRDLQLEIISSIARGKDTLAVLATGSGKSLCYQVPAMYLDGCCIVVSPLIALMKDQLSSLKKRNIPSVALHSGQDKRTQDILLDNVAYGNIKFLFVSPERLQTHLFVERLKKMKISMIAVDEAHCISEWGHEFRPSYREIAQLRSLAPDAPLLALTATATKRVQQDIIDNLKLTEPNSFLQSPVRSQLSYFVHYSENKRNDLFHLVKDSSNSSIIYVNKRMLTRELQSYLQTKGIESSIFHAGLDAGERMQIIERWNKDEIKIIIATNAFGMGMDKPDVRCVINYTVPASLEAYVQESGRAGRDGQLSRAILLWNKHDVESLESKIKKNFPPKDFIKRVYKNLSIFLNIATGPLDESWQALDIEKFRKAYDLPRSELMAALRILEEADYLKLSDRFKHPSRLRLNEIQLRRFMQSQERNDKLMHFLKSILRTYEGIYWEYCAIDESKLARLNNTSTAKIRPALRRLKKMQLADYEEQFEGYKISFGRYRVNHYAISISEEIYTLKKKRMQRRMKKVISYINDRECRQEVISEYFGFRIKKACGICDNCQEILNDKEIKSLLNKHLKTAKGIHISELLLSHNTQNRRNIVRSMERLYGEKKVEIKNDIIRRVD
jgi:ATP-dependent DNA helicase RecQ